MKLLVVSEFTVLIALGAVVSYILSQPSTPRVFSHNNHIQLLNLHNVSLLATPNTKSVNANMWWFAAQQVNIFGELNTIDCSTVVFFNETTLYYPHRLFCASLFGDTASFMTDKYESMFECGRTDHAGFHCASSTHIYDYCVTWSDVGTTCRHNIVTNTSVLYDDSIVERPVPGDNATLVYIYRQFSANGTLCINANSTAVPGVLRIVHPDFTLALDSRGKSRCMTHAVSLAGEFLRLDNFYIGDSLILYT
jgi:hypothetical protein